MCKRMYWFQSLSFVVCAFWGMKGFAWNALGHQLVAQIAYDKLMPQARQFCNRYLFLANKKVRLNKMVYVATWLDLIRYKEIHWYDTLHYIDIPFSKDDTSLPTFSFTNNNAVWAINQAQKVLHSKKTNAMDKGLALRILIHVVGDLHQPLHSTTLVSKALPQGDLGGNLFPLGSNPLANQLHAYWDKGGGFLTPPRKSGYNRAQTIQIMAKQLEKKWPCDQANGLTTAQQWAAASHELAVNVAYNITPETTPSASYQQTVQTVTQQQLVFAGCRLAKVLNAL